MPARHFRTLRSDILVHWTGRRIEAEYKDHPDDCVRHQKYLDTLKSILCQGFWMKNLEVELYHKKEGKPFVFCWPAVCFTEIKLSRVSSHVKRYGHLGLGFTREFVMERYGAPVLYVPGPKELYKGAGRMIAPHVAKLLCLLGSLVEKTATPKSKSRTSAEFEPRKDFPGYCKFEKFLEAYNVKALLSDADYNKRDWELFVGARASLISVFIFLKSMSDKESRNAYELLDELEWRIPYVNDKPQFFKPTGWSDPEYRMAFGRNDLKLIVFPDPKTLELALKNDYIKCWFSGKFPSMVTVDECSNFG